MLQRIPWGVWAPFVGGALALSTLGGAVCYHTRTVRQLEASVRAEQALRDTARVKEAAATADKARYQELYEFAKALGGKPVAGTTVVIRQVDTTVIHDSVPTTVQPDSTRVAHIRDSTTAGVLDATLTAPPCCAPLGFRYTLTRPELRPVVGFTRVGPRTLVTVTLDGDTAGVTTESPFMIEPTLPRWERFVGVYSDPDAMSARLGTSLRLWRQLRAQVVAERRFAPNTPGLLQIGAEWRW